MKLNSTVALTLVLLTLMLGAGVVSALAGFTMGHEALKGVRQPDARPTKKLAAAKANNSTNPNAGVPVKEVAMLKEDKILAEVKQYIRNGGKDSPSKAKSDAENSEEKSKSSEEKPSEEKSTTAKLPMATENKGVKMEVKSASQEGGSLLFSVTLKNEGSQPVRFLYSFLNVTDDQGRTLSAVTEGLPGELPANSDTFTGTISIPTALLEDSKQLSLSLTDYPDQQLQLQLSGLPVEP